MPYKVYKVGEQYCVHKKKPDGSRGAKKGCHSSAAKARKHQAALYVAEGKKEIPMADKEIEVVEQTMTVAEDGTVRIPSDEQVEKEKLEKGYVPWGVTSFAELEKAREAAEAAARTYDLMSDFTGIVSNILSDSDIEDKVSAVAKATKEMENMLGSPKKEKVEDDQPAWQKSADAVIDWFKDFFVKEEEQEESEPNFMIWKEADGTTRWMAVYSNKFRDEDQPPEIISEKSHIRFEQLIDTKQAAMPELWLWHTPEWKFGVADWIAWDDEGFAIASGTIDEGKEAVAEWVGKQQDVAVSHGMPKDSILRDPDDPTIIVGHITREVSPLPYSAAANKRTDFLIFGNDTKNKQEDVMAISDEKKQELQESWNAPDGILERLEAANSDKAQKALDEDVDFKETESEETVAEEEVTSEAETAETTESEETAETTAQSETEEPEVEGTDAEELDQSEYPTRDEVVEAITPMAKQIAALEQTVGVLVDAVKELVADDEDKISKAAASVPPASIAAMVAKNQSAVGSTETQIKGSTSLAKSKPEEAATVGRTGIEFIDEMLQAEH